MTSAPALLAERVALVVGGAGGIGGGIAECLAAAGAVSVIADLDRDAGKRRADAIAAAGLRAQFELLDVTAANAVDTLTESIIGQHGRIDILVNCAAALPIRELIETSDEEWERTMRINLFGPFYTARAVARHMRPRRYGKIINIASELTPAQLAGVYSTSKWGLVGLTRNLAIELAPHHINVNAIAPGTTPTDMWKQAMTAKGMRLGITLDEFSHTADASIPWGRKGTPQDIGNAVVFLASDNAEYITGELLHVSGGQRGPGTLPARTTAVAATSD